LLEGTQSNVQISQIHPELFFLSLLLCFITSCYSRSKVLIFSANIIYEISKAMRFLSFHFDIVSRAPHFFILAHFRLTLVISSEVITPIF